MPHFYKNKNQTETQKNSDKHKTGGINVYTFIFLRKNIRINIYPLSENPLGGFPFSLLFVRIAHEIVCEQRRQKSSLRSPNQRTIKALFMIIKYFK